MQQIPLTSFFLTLRTVDQAHLQDSVSRSVQISLSHIQDVQNDHSVCQYHILSSTNGNLMLFCVLTG